jgi:RNA polymerase sigma-70 factor, ECF subfamily
MQPKVSMNIALKGHLYTDEFDLAEACKKGIPLAQNILYRTYAPKMLTLCFRYVGNAEDAQEILGDAFVDAFRKCASFQYLGTGSLKAWLTRIAVNRCLMFLRRKSMNFEDLSEDYGAYMETPATVMDEINAKELMNLIHELPAGYRTVFNLFVFEDMPHKEIASVLGISESTSKTQLHKARQLLQHKIRINRKDIL